MVEAWRSGGVALLGSTGLARVCITSLLLFAISICLMIPCEPSTARDEDEGPINWGSCDRWWHAATTRLPGFYWLGCSGYIVNRGPRPSLAEPDPPAE